MKKTLFALLAACAVGAGAQSIPTPASSVNSGAQGVVAITPVDTSNLATKTEVNNAYNSAINHIEYRYNQAVAHTNGTASRSMWSRYFPGQQQSAICTSTWGATSSSVTFYAYIDGNGYVSVRNAFSSWVGLGYPLGNNGFFYQTAGGGLGGGCYLTVAPYTSANYNGTPSGWRLQASGTEYGQP